MKIISPHLIKSLLITFCLLTFTSLFAQAYFSGTDKLISVVEKNISLREVFKKIEQQTNIHFSWNEDVVPMDERISCNFLKRPLTEVLNSLLNNKIYSWKLDNNVIYIQKKETHVLLNGEIKNIQEDSTIKNVRIMVTDRDGSPLPSVTILDKNTKYGVVTDGSGIATLKITRDGVIQASSIGFKKVEIPYKGEPEIRIVLQTTINNIEEVAVFSNGYQDVPQERATGSFEKVSGKLLNQQVGPYILDRLNGVASALQFDDTHGGNRTVGFMIRGISTIQGNMDPLIVVDNFPYDGDIKNINPNDVSNVTILKDAAASSIWGARAGNGVVVITTKKGNFGQPLTIGFNTNVTVAGKPDLFAVPQMSSSDYIDVEEMLFNNGAYINQENNPSRPALTPVVETLIAVRDGKMTEEQGKAQIDSYRKQDVRNDYKKYVYKNAVNQQYALNINGGAQNYNYYLSAGYDRNLDALKSAYDRINLRMRNIYNVTKKIQITTGLLYTQSKNTSGQSGIGNPVYPYEMLADRNGNPLPLDLQYRKLYTDTAGNGKLLNWDYYPLEDWKHQRTNANIYDLLGDLGVSYNIFDGFSFKVQYQYERQQTNLRNLQDLQSYNTRSLINNFTQILPDGSVVHPIPVGDILGGSTAEGITHNVRGQFDLKHTWGRNNIAAIAGGEIRQNHQQLTSFGAYGYSDDPLYYQNVDYVNAYPTYVNGYYLTIPSFTDFGDVLTRFTSIFSNISYTYNNKYILSASARKDAANIFGVNTNRRSTPLWSSGAAWIISDEPFYKFKSLPYLKLRATYGFSGNAGQGLSGKTIIAHYSNAQFTNLPYAQIQQVGNPDLRWENVNTINVGIDFASINNRIEGSIEYYKKHCFDLFGPTLVDGTTGYPFPTLTKNVADVNGNGVEITINSRNINSRFSWNTRFLFNYNSNKVAKYYNPIVNNSTYVQQGGSIASPIVGQQVYSIISYKWTGLDHETGKAIGVLNGKPSQAYDSIIRDSNINDLVFSGSSLPQIYGSLLNTFSWKGISLDICLSYKLDYYFRRNNIMSYTSLLNGSTISQQPDYAKRWQKPGDEQYTNVPSLSYPTNALSDQLYAGSIANVLKGDNIRLQYLNVTYNFPKFLSGSWSKKSIQVYANLSNLGIIWRANKLGIDPEFNGTLPIPKSYAFGVRVGM